MKKRSPFAGSITAWRKARAVRHPEARYIGEPAGGGHPVKRRRTPKGQLVIGDRQ